MKQLLITIAALVLAGSGESQQSATSPEAEPIEPLAEVAKPEPPTAKAPEISIHDAAMKGNIEAVKQHLDAGGDVNVKYKDFLGTPLHAAVFDDRSEIAELLIAAGADVNARNAERVRAYLTPLDMARNYPETASLLRKHGAKTG